MGVRVVGLLVFLAFGSCTKDSSSPADIKVDKRVFESSFESETDFSGFYITPQGHQGTTYQELTDSMVHTGNYAHKAWIIGANPASTNSVNNNHRGYPTVQFQNTEEGVFKTPCYITLWVWVDMELKKDSLGGEDDWLSLATFTDDESVNWSRTVLVNVGHEGFLHLGHVPIQGQQEYIFQNKSLKFPQKEWVEIKVFFDFGVDGYAKVWQNGTLVSHAKVNNVENKLSQAHFGLYCPPQMISGIVFNDDLLIREVESE